MTRRVTELMTRYPVTVAPHCSAQEAIACADEHGLHHLPVVDPKRGLVGLVCLCDLERSKPHAAVSACMSTPVVAVPPNAFLSDAAVLMREHGVGCLPVVCPQGQLLGVITRRDLREAGLLGNEPGVDACGACGSTHALARAGEPGEPVFCSDCIERGGGWMFEFYDTLGGSG
jgi:CBS domain-containing protein